jgi:uncharacterized protein (TIGR02217 family)
MSFLDVRFPKDISYGSSCGPVYNTSVIEMSSGREKRNQNWLYPRSEYDVAYGVKRRTQLEELIALFHVVRGRAHSFRYWDPLDYKSCSVSATPAMGDVIVGTGDGTTTDFQLVKSYTVTGVSGQTFSQIRKITKPVPGTVYVGIDGVEAFPDIVYDTGIISFSTAPESGQIITAGYEFDVHARFNTDSLPARFDDFESLSASVPVIELS